MRKSNYSLKRHCCKINITRLPLNELSDNDLNYGGVFSLAVPHRGMSLCY